MLYVNEPRQKYQIELWDISKPYNLNDMTLVQLDFRVVMATGRNKKIIVASACSISERSVQTGTQFYTNKLGFCRSRAQPNTMR
jgi:hypothetical protein